MRFFSSLAALLAIFCLTASCSTVERVADYYRYRGEYHVRTVPGAKRATRHAEAGDTETQAALLKPDDIRGVPATYQEKDPMMAQASERRPTGHQVRHWRNRGLAAPAAVRPMAVAQSTIQASPKSIQAHKGSHAAASPTGLAMAMAGDNQIVATVLCFFFGLLGVHRFYLGYIWQGVVQLLTLGGFGIWTLIDFIRIIIGDLKPNGGRYSVRF